MSNPQNHRPDESSGHPSTWDDERITAYVMNELSAEEKLIFEQELSQNSELATAVAEARQVAQQLAGFYAAMPAAKLDANRREQIVGAVSAEPNPSTGKPGRGSGRSGKRYAIWAVAASILFIGLAVHALSRFGTHTAMTEIKKAARGRTAETSAPDEVTVAPNRAVATREFANPADAGAARMAPQDSISERASRDTAQSFGMELQASSNRQADVDASGAPKRAAGETAAAASAFAADAAAAPTAPSPIAGRLAAPSGPALRASSAMDVEGGAAKRSPRTDEKSASSRGAEMSRGMGMGGAAEMPAQRAASGGAVSEALSDRPTLQKSHRGLESSLRPGLPSSPGDGMHDDAVGAGTGPGSSGDKFSPLIENSFRRVSEHPLSTLSIDVDTASYAKVRSYLQRNQLPRPDSVRIEEMVNYFDYDYTGPVAVDGQSSDPFTAAMTATVCPWEPRHRLVRVGLQAQTLSEQERPRCNLVFLIDTSGSMNSANKLPLVIDGMKLLLQELRDEDRVAIVVYAGSAGLVLDSTPVQQRQQIVRALTQLQSGGSTNGGAGLQLAYDTAREHFIEGGVNRVILCSDGDFNVGMTGTDQLVREAKTQAKSGVELTVLGFGMGNHNDAMMERISNDAEGNYAFVDTLGEARKVLVDQLSGTLITVAKDVKIQIEFNPAVVSSYRLIGYENRLLAQEDFNDDTKDAGEIGAGHRVTAFYEVVPAGTLPDAVAPAVDPLKYQGEPKTEPADAAEEAAEQDGPPLSAEMLTFKLRYKAPQGDTSTLMTRVLEDTQLPFEQADNDFRFAAAVAAFGMQLRASEFAGSWTYDDILRVAQAAIGEDPNGLRAELIELVQTARKLTQAE